MHETAPTQSPVASDEAPKAFASPRTDLWLAVALLVLLCGLAFQLGLLVYAMYVLLGILGISHILTRTWTEALTAKRECSLTSASIGDKAAVIVRITNGSRWTIPWLLVEDSLPRSALRQRPPRLVLEKRRLRLLRLAAGETQSLLYQLQFATRGYYQIGPLLAETGDVFGLQRRFRVLTRPHFVLVYPRVVPLAGYDVLSRRPIGEVRMTHKLFEDPTRISGVRPYEIGDPLNRIHWKATARTGALHSKTFEPSTVAGATILVDLHTAQYASRTEPHKSELCVTAAASLANAVSLLDQQVGCCTNGRDAVDRIRTQGWDHEFTSRDVARAETTMRSDSTRLQPVMVPTRRSPEQLTRILEMLARTELTDGLPFADLVREVSGRLPRDATVIAVLPNAPPETAVALQSLKSQGFAVAAVLVMFADEPDYSESAGRLLQAAIDVRHVEDESSLAMVCSQRLHTGPVGLTSM